jgi:hypothetical protein
MQTSQPPLPNSFYECPANQPPRERAHACRLQRYPRHGRRHLRPRGYVRALFSVMRAHLLDTGPAFNREE